VDKGPPYQKKRKGTTSKREGVKANAIKAKKANAIKPILRRFGRV
jgi:hypothetical protein